MRPIKGLDRTKLCCPNCNKRFAIRDLGGVSGFVVNLSTCRCDLVNAKSDGVTPAAPKIVNDESKPVETPSLPDCIDDRFEVLQLLGTGGMGTVYKVRDKELNQIFALKTLNLKLAEDVVAKKRFEQEAEAAQKLNHANLVSVYGHGLTKSGDAYLLMEYVHGESLSHAIAREGVLDTDRAIKIFTQICDALIHAHENKTIHRDIKPANIILAKTENGEETARIVDFGVAKTMPATDRETRDLTQTGEVFGSPHYMSPEQCLGFMLDQRSDIYSLGCLMYETLAGKAPFDGSNPIQLVVKHINERAKPFLSSTEKCPKLRGLQSIILRCLEKDQMDRFQDINEIKDLLLSASRGEQLVFVADSKLKEAVLNAQVEPLSYLMATVILLPCSLVTLPAIAKSLPPMPIEGLPFFGMLSLVTMVALVVTMFWSWGLACIGIAKEGMASKRHWWITMSMFFSAGLGASMVLMGIWAAFCTIEEQIPLVKALLKYSDVVILLGGSLLLFSAMGCVISPIAANLDRGRKHVQFKDIATKALLTVSTVLFCLVAAFPVQTATLLSQAGHSFSELSEANKVGVGLRLSKLAYRMAPNSTDVLDSLSQAEYAEKLYPESSDHLLKLINTAKDPIKKAEYAGRRGSILQEQGQLNDAIEEYSRVISLSPDSYVSFCGRAACYKKMGKYALADADFGNALVLDPSIFGLYYRRASTKLALGDIEDGIKLLDRCMDLTHGKNPTAYAFRGFLYAKLGKADLAKQDYLAAIEAQKNDSAYFQHNIGRAIAYIMLGDPDRAKKEFSIAKTKEFNLEHYKNYYNFLPDELKTTIGKTIPELK